MKRRSLLYLNFSFFITWDGILQRHLGDFVAAKSSANDVALDTLPRLIHRGIEPALDQSMLRLGEDHQSSNPVGNQSIRC